MKSTPSSDKTLAMVQSHETQVLARPTRRRFTISYKRRILAECDCAPPGGIGSILRREGLYSSHLANWRRAFDNAHQHELDAPRRGRKPHPDRDLLLQNQALQRKAAKLEARLAQAHSIIDIQKKLSELLGISLETNSVETS